MASVKALEAAEEEQASRLRSCDEDHEQVSSAACGSGRDLWIPTARDLFPADSDIKLIDSDFAVHRGSGQEAVESPSSTS
jgi:hypothetical protein